ncbi:far upstream element-binding protein 1-like [Gossypium australe]|uniref:Far upstream element-binding protein 1-like n=1 Tax=Gossypium australe TaxID=47621 RepID=A0A5B6W438_9ROSI|nr:far upstream element-binding protein 1-like [Gossypium australe]
MAAPQEIQVTFVSGKDLQNVNWRHGPIKPYAVVRRKSRHICYPTWNSTLVIPLFCPINDDTNLYVDVIHAGNEEKTKPLIRSAKLNLRDVLKDGGRYGEYEKSLKLKRPSGRPQGKVDVKVLIRGPGYHVPDQSRAIPSYGYPQLAPYGVPQSAPYGAHPSTPYGAYPPASYGALSGYGYPYAQPLQQPQNPNYPFAQQGGYSYNA